MTGEFEHAWYIDSQKFTPGLVAPIGSVDFEPVPGQVGRHPLLTLTRGGALHRRGSEDPAPRLHFRQRLAADAVPALPDQVQAEGGWDHHDSKASHFVMADQPEQLLEIMLGLAELMTAQARARPWTLACARRSRLSCLSVVALERIAAGRDREHGRQLSRRARAAAPMPSTRRRAR